MSIFHQALHNTEETKELRDPRNRQRSAFAAACRYFSLLPGADDVSNPGLS